MGFVAQIFLLLTGLVALSHTLKDEAQRSPDPSVFEMQPPAWFPRLVPTRNEDSEDPVKFHFWSSHIRNEDIMKFPDWFHFTDTKPETDVKVDKNTEKDEQSDVNNPKNKDIDWKEGSQNVFAYMYVPVGDKSEDKQRLPPPPYFNNFLSGTYPSWMTMAGLKGSLNNEKGKESEEFPKNLDSPKSEKSDIANLSPKENAKLPEKQAKATEISDIDRLKEVITPDDKNLKTSKNIKDSENDIKVITNPNPIALSVNAKDVIPESIEKAPAEIIKETEESAEAPVTKLSADDPKPILETVKVPEPVVANGVDVPQKMDSPVGSVVIVPMNMPIQSKNTPGILLAIPNNQTPLIARHNAEEIPDPTPLPSVENLEKKTSSIDQDQNEDWKKILYNLLQNAKPIFASLSSSTTNSSPNTPQVAAMIVPLNDNPNPNGRSIISGNNLVINNADRVPNIGQTVNHATPNLPINGASLSQNLNPQTSPNNMHTNQGNLPNNIILNQPNLPNRNQGNIPTNPPNYSPYGNINQNNNYYPNLGTPVLLTFPTANSNMPMNALPNTGSQMNARVNTNGQPLQPNLGPNQMPLNNNNMGPISPGNYPNYNNQMNLPPGQNIYAILPFTNVGNGNMNTGPNLYPNSNNNPQLNPNANTYQVVGSLPMYNLVPVNNVLVNTKDEEDD